MSSEKDALRQEFAQIRVGVGFRAQKDCQILKNVLELLQDKPGGVFVYVSMQSEADTHALIGSLYGKTDLYVPHIRNGQMLQARYNGEPLSPDRFGNIFAADKPAAVVYPAVTVVPMLCFTKSLYRLGYGKGYYDRYLSLGRTYSIGIAFDEQRTDRMPIEPHDRPLDCIVTPSGVYTTDKSIR